MKCSFCNIEKRLVYDSIYTGSVCTDCYLKAVTIADIAKINFKIIEKYDSNDNKCHLLILDNNKKIIDDKIYTNRVDMLNALKIAVKKKYKRCTK